MRTKSQCVESSGNDLPRVGAFPVGGRRNDDSNLNDDSSDSDSDRSMPSDGSLTQSVVLANQGYGAEPLRVVTAELVDEDAEERRIMEQLPRVTAVELTDREGKGLTGIWIKGLLIGSIAVAITTVVVAISVTMSARKAPLVDSDPSRAPTNPLSPTVLSKEEPSSNVLGTPTNTPTYLSPTEQPNHEGQDTQTSVPPVVVESSTKAPAALIAISTREDLLSRIDWYLNHLQDDGSVGQLPETWIPMRQWDISTISNCSQLFDAKQRNSRARLFNNPDIALWDTSGCTTMRNMFYDAKKFNQDLSRWNVSRVTDMSSMFYGASLFDQDLSTWNVASVTDMSAMFSGASSYNQDLSAWDVSSVVDMNGMFQNMYWLTSGASSFNQDLSTWNVSRVTRMNRMFIGATHFNQDLSTWDVSSVTDMGRMFEKAESFSQDLSTWDVSNVEDMRSMFEEATSFNQDLSTWNVLGVKNMRWMFKGASFFNQGLSTWDVSSVTDMRAMFDGAASFNQDLSTWNVSNVRNMDKMFSAAQSFNQDLSAWDVSSVTDMSFMFHNASEFNQNLCRWRETLTPRVSRSMMFFGTTCPSSDGFCHECHQEPFENLQGTVISTREELLSRIDRYLNYIQDDGSDLGQLPESLIPMRLWDITAISNCSHLFDAWGRNSRAGLFNNPDIALWDTSGCTTMKAMFHGAVSFNQDLSKWDVSRVTDMSFMFAGASLFDQDLSMWNVSSVTDMSAMFHGPTLFNHDLSTWDVSRVTDMGGMFYDARSFNQDLSTWNVANVTNMASMFDSASAFDQDLSNWNVSRVTDMGMMFIGAESFNQDLSRWDVSSVTSTMWFMFTGAASFNQNLCGWRELVNPAVDRYLMFQDTACPSTSSEDFCHTCFLLG